MDTPPSFLRRVAGVFLGLFVLWQLFFLVSANLLRLLEDAKPQLKEVDLVRQTLPEWSSNEGTLHAALTTVSRADKRWGELTGQQQSWSLFAPSVYEHIPFPALVLRWDDDRQPALAAAGLLGTPALSGPLETVLVAAAAEQARAKEIPTEEALPSENEPSDRHRYFRYGRFRVRRYEGNVTLVLAQGRTADAWRGKIEDHLREEGDYIHAYLRWRLEAFRRAHPELPPPRQVILLMRTYRIPAPPGPAPWDWQALEPQPVARWLPGAEPGPEYLPLEMYNPVTSRFESLRK